MGGTAIPVVLTDDGCIHMCQFVQVDRGRAVEVLLFNLAVWLLVPEDQVDLCTTVTQYTTKDLTAANSKSPTYLVG